MDVLTGENLSDDSMKVLLQEPHEITKNIYLILKESRPVPFSNIFKHPAWQESPYSKIRETDDYWIDACGLMCEESALRTPIEHLEELSQMDPNKLQFRSNGHVKYMTVSKSLEMLTLWIQFQFKDRADIFVHDVWDWLAGKKTKINGFEVIGEPNSGKSFFMQPLIHSFPGFGFVKPAKGYAFNWDNVRSKYC